MPTQRQRPHSARLPRVPERQQSCDAPRRPETAPLRRNDEYGAEWLDSGSGLLALRSDDTDPLDESLDRSRNVVSAFWDLQYKLQQSETRLTEERQARVNSSQTIRALEACDEETRAGLKDALSRLEVAEKTAKLTAEQLRFTEGQLRLSQEEVERFQAVNTSLGNQMEAQRADFMAEADDYVERYATFKAKHEILLHEHDNLKRHYMLANSSLDSAIQVHEAYKADVHSIQAGFERVLSLQQQELERLLADCASSKKAQAQLDRVLMTNKRLEESMAAAEAHATQSLSHAVKALRKQIFAEDHEIIGRCFGDWLVGVNRIKASRKRKEQHMTRTLRGISAHDEALQAHYLTIWARSARALRREHLLRMRSLNVLTALENQLHLQVEKLTSMCFDDWRGVVGNRRKAKLRQECLVRRNASVSSRMLLMDCMLALKHLAQVLKRERHLEGNRQKAVQALRKQLHYQGLALHEHVLEYWRDAVAMARENRKQKEQSISRALRLQASLNEAKQAQCFVSWAYAAEVAKQGQVLQTHKDKALLVFQKQIAQHDGDFVRRCLEHWRGLAYEAQCSRERLQENINLVLRTIVWQEKEAYLRCFSSWVNEVRGAAHYKKLFQQKEANVVRALRGVLEFYQSFLKQCFLSWFWIVMYARRAALEQSALEMEAKLAEEANERLTAARARKEELLQENFVQELTKLREEASKGLEASQRCAVDVKDIISQRDLAVQSLAHAEKSQEDLRKMVADLEQELQETKNQLLQSRRDVAETEQQCQVHKSRLEASQQECSRLVDDLKGSLSQEVLEAKELLGSRQEEIERLQVENERLKTESRQTNDLLRASKEDADKLLAVLKELAKHRDNTKALFEFSKRSCEENTSALKEFAFTLASAQEELQASQQRLAWAEDEVAKLRAAKQSIEQERDDAQRQVDNIQRRLSASSFESEELLKQQVEAARRLSEIEERLATANSILLDRERQLADAQDAIEEANDRCNQQTEQIAKLQNALEVVQAQQARAQAELEEAERRLQDPAEAVRHLAEELEKVSAELEERDSRLAAVFKELTDIKASHDKAIEEFEEMRQKRDELQELRDELQKQLEEVQAENSAKTSSLESLEAELREIKQYCESLGQQLTLWNVEKSRELQACEERANSSAEVLKGLAQELDDVKRQRDDALSRLATCESDMEVLQKKPSSKDVASQCEECNDGRRKLAEELDKDLRQKFQDAKLENEEKSEAIANLQKQCADLEQRLAESELRNVDIARELHILKENVGESDMGRKALTEELNDARRQQQEAQLMLNACEKEKEDLRQQISAAQVRIGQAEEALDDYKKHGKDLELDLVESEARNKDAAWELSIAKEGFDARLKALQQELDDARRQQHEAQRMLEDCEKEKECLGQQILAAQGRTNQAEEASLLRLQSENEHLRAWGQRSKTAMLDSGRSVAGRRSQLLLCMCVSRWHLEARELNARRSRQDLVSRIVLQRESTLSRESLGRIWADWMFAMKVSKQAKAFSAKRSKLMSALQAEIQGSEFFPILLFLRLWKHAAEAEKRVNVVANRRYSLGTNLTERMLVDSLKQLHYSCFHPWFARARAVNSQRMHIVKSIEDEAASRKVCCLVLALRAWKQLVSKELQLRLERERQRNIAMNIANAMIHNAAQQLMSSCFDLWHLRTQVAQRDTADTRLPEALASVAKAELEIDQLRHALRVTENLAADLQTDVAKSANENDQLRSEIAKSGGEMQELRAELRKSELAIERLQSTLVEAETESSALRCKFSAAEQDLAKAVHDADTSRNDLTKAQQEVQALRGDLDSSREQNRLLLERLTQEQSSQDMQDRMNSFLSTASNALARSQSEEAALIAWMRQERDECRCRLEIAERRCAELSDSLQKREDLLKDARIELEHYQTTLRRARLEQGTMHPVGLTDYDQILLMQCIRAWCFWYPRKVDSSGRTAFAGPASASLDRSSRPLSGISQQSSRSIPESWSQLSQPVRPPSAARSSPARSSRTLPLRPSSAMASMRNGTLSRPTSAMSARSGSSHRHAESIGNGILVKQLAAVLSSSVSTHATEQ